MAQLIKKQLGGFSTFNKGKDSPIDRRTPAQKAADQKKSDASAKKQREFLYNSASSIVNTVKKAIDPKERAKAKKKIQSDLKSGKLKIAKTGGSIKLKKK